MQHRKISANVSEGPESLFVRFFPSILDLQFQLQSRRFFSKKNVWTKKSVSHDNEIIFRDPGFDLVDVGDVVSRRASRDQVALQRQGPRGRVGRRQPDVHRLQLAADLGGRVLRALVRPLPEVRQGLEKDRRGIRR